METITNEIKEKYGLYDTIDEVFDFIANKPRNQRGKDSIEWIAHYMKPLYEYSTECDSIVEMGINQCNSTWAFLKAKPKNGVTSIDISLKGGKHAPQFNDENVWIHWARELAKKENVEFSVIKESTLKVNIAEVDLIFIDTKHTYEQLRDELKLHGNKSRKYIILHDTVLFPQLNKAIDEFLAENDHWTVKEKFNDNPGLTILSRS